MNELSWVAVTICLLSYATGSLLLFSWMNVVCAPFIAWPSIAHHIYQPVVINAAFFLVGAFNLWRHYGADR